MPNKTLGISASENSSKTIFSEELCLLGSGESFRENDEIRSKWK